MGQNISFVLLILWPSFDDHESTYACICYPLFESGTETGLRTITLCRKDRGQLSKHK